MKTNVNDMTSGNPAKHIILFALPLMLGNALQQLYIMADAAVVGRAIGFKALAAIGAADWLYWMVLSTVIGFCQGFSILVSQYFGAEDYDSMRKSVTMSVLLSAAIAVIVTAVCVPATRLMLSALQTPADIIENSKGFLQILFAGIFVTTAYNTLSAILRALGDGRTPMIAMAAASVMNIVLDILFIVILHFGVAAAAAATVTAQVMACIICLGAIKKISILKMKHSDWKPDKEMIRKLIALGTPMASQNAIIGAGGMVVQYVINGFGVLFVAGFTAGMKLYGLFELAATSFGFAVATYTGQNFGAREYRRIRKGTNSALIMSVSIALLISITVIIFGSQIVRFFVSGAEADITAVIAVAKRYLVIMSIFLFVLYMLYIYRSALQGMGDTVIPMVSGIVELIMRVSTVLLLPLLIGQFGVYFAEIVAWIGAETLLMATYYYRMRQMFKTEYVAEPKLDIF